MSYPRSGSSRSPGDRVRAFLRPFPSAHLPRGQMDLLISKAYKSPSDLSLAPVASVKEHSLTGTVLQVPQIDFRVVYKVFSDRIVLGILKFCRVHAVSCDFVNHGTREGNEHRGMSGYDELRIIFFQVFIDEIDQRNLSRWGK